MNRVVAVLFLIGILWLGVTSEALAQGTSSSTRSTSSGTKNGQSKRTSINFEDQLVEGQTQKPELFYLLQQRNNNFKRLIRLRENFLPEMRKTSEDMGRRNAGAGEN